MAETPDESHPERTEPTDARVELTQLARGLRETVLDVLWRQWRVIGARSASWHSGAERPMPTLIDPEALVLISLVLLDDEPRLADVMRDWVALNADVLSVQRLKNLSDGYFSDPRVLTSRLAWLAATAGEKGKPPRWHALAVSPAATAGSGADDSAPVARPVTRGGRRAVTPNNADRAPVRPALARFPDPPALTLRFRLAFGVGVKADLLALLFTKSALWPTIRQIADATGYTVAATRRGADDLVAAGLLSVRPDQPARYGFVHAPWAPLLGLDADRPMRWGYWHERFQVTADLLQWAAAAQLHPLSPYAAGAQGRALLERHRGALTRDDPAPWALDVVAPDGVAVLRAEFARLGESMQQDA